MQFKNPSILKEKNDNEVRTPLSSMKERIKRITDGEFTIISINYLELMNVFLIRFKDWNSGTFIG